MTTKITRHITKHPPSGPQSLLQDLEIWTGSVSVCDEKSFFANFPTFADWSLSLL